MRLPELYRETYCAESWDFGLKVVTLEKHGSLALPMHQMPSAILLRRGHKRGISEVSDEWESHHPFF